MPESRRTTFAKRLAKERQVASQTPNRAIAADIWTELKYIFESYSKYELECIDVLAITVTEKADRLELSVTTTDHRNHSDETEPWGNIFMSAEKLNRLHAIMKSTMRMAETEGVQTWTDVDDDNHRFWGFYIDFEDEKGQ